MKSKSTTSSANALTSPPAEYTYEASCNRDGSRKPWDLAPFAKAIGWKSVESVRHAIRQGRIRARKFGRYWKIPVAVAEEIFRNGVPSLLRSKAANEPEAGSSVKNTVQRKEREL